MEKDLELGVKLEVELEDFILDVFGCCVVVFDAIGLMEAVHSLEGTGKACALVLMERAVDVHTKFRTFKTRNATPI